MCAGHGHVRTPGMSRRTFLLGCGAIGLGAVAGTCTRWGAGGGDRNAKTEPLAVGTTRHAPAPDLGSEMFPDASGRAIASQGDAPVIMVPRSAWALKPPHLEDIDVMGGFEHITVHHTAWAPGGDKDAWFPTVEEIEHIQEFHQGEKRQWADIAYHWVIDRPGRVWQGRPMVYQGAHVKSHNLHNIGIVLLGNFDEQRPAAAQLTSLAAFLVFLRQVYHVPATEVFTHGELGQTSCPGKTLQAYMNRLRASWAVATHA